MRKGELLGIYWNSVDLDSGKVTVSNQLIKSGPKPEFGPPKRGRIRTIQVSQQTIGKLKAHRKHQAEIRLKNRTTYRDFDLVFARTWESKGRLGEPLSAYLIQREFSDIIKAAGVRSIKFHGLRHSSATLLLGAGVPPHIVKDRLGHSSIDITVDLYGHAMPDQQQAAAEKVGEILYGRDVK